MKHTMLIKNIAAVTDAPQRVVEAVLKELAAQVQASAFSGEDLALPGIGKLSVASRAARTGRNPRTGEQITIPAKRVPAFSAAKALKDACNR